MREFIDIKDKSKEVDYFIFMTKRQRTVLKLKIRKAVCKFFV
jgi:hypothetical protein